jgi:hypothetical protein
MSEFVWRAVHELRAVIGGALNLFEHLQLLERIVADLEGERAQAHGVERVSHLVAPAAAGVGSRG